MAAATMADDFIALISRSCSRACWRQLHSLAALVFAFVILAVQGSAVQVRNRA